MNQGKHNTLYVFKAGMVSKVLTDQARPQDQDIKAPMQETWSKWVEMQQQLMAAVKGVQSVPKKTQWQISTRVRGGIVRIPVLLIHIPNGKATVTIMVQPEVTKPRLEWEMIEIKFNVTTVKGGDTYAMSAWALWVWDL